MDIFITYHLMDLGTTEGSINTHKQDCSSQGTDRADREINIGTLLYWLVNSPAPKLPEYPSSNSSPFSRNPQDFPMSSNQKLDAWPS